MHTQSLSFRVRIARTRNDLQAACRVRAQSYGHHLPKMQSVLLEPDLLDADDHTFVVVCVDKTTGCAVGTARFQTNTGGPLLIEHSMAVPQEMQGDTRAEITRFSALSGADPLVKLALMKASYLFCLASQVRWMVIGARAEALIRQYMRLGFTDLFEDQRLVPLLHAGKLGHRILAFNVTSAERIWQALHHPLYDFFVETAHPDIELFSMLPALPTRDATRSGQRATTLLQPLSRETLSEPPRRSGSMRATMIN